MVDFEKMADSGRALKQRLATAVETIAGYDRDIDGLKAQRKEALATAEADDKLVPVAVAFLAHLHRTGKSARVTSADWPMVEKYAEVLGLVLPGNDQPDLFAETD